MLNSCSDTWLAFCRLKDFSISKRAKKWCINDVLRYSDAILPRIATVNSFCDHKMLTNDDRHAHNYLSLLGLDFDCILPEDDAPCPYTPCFQVYDMLLSTFQANSALSVSTISGRRWGDWLHLFFGIYLFGPGWMGLAIWPAGMFRITRLLKLIVAGAEG